MVGSATDFAGNNVENPLCDLISKTVQFLYRFNPSLMVPTWQAVKCNAM